MNSYITIQVRVAARQAQAALAGVKGDVAAVGAASRASGSALANFAYSIRPNLLQRFGNQLQWTGRVLMRNFTIPLAIAGGAALKFELDNERAMVGIIKVYGDGSKRFNRLTKTEIPALGRAFEVLSNEFAVNRKEVIDIAGAWAQAGSSGLALAKATKLTLETMILGEMNATEATQALIAIQAQYGQSTNQLSKTIDILNMVENQTGITMQGLVQGFARAAGTARSAGVDVRHLAAFLAALTPAAGSAANAGNALKTIFSRLMAPTKDAAEVMKLMGINTRDATWQSMNGTQRLEEMARKFHDLSGAQRLVVSSTIASRFQINRFDVLMRDVYSKTGYYAKALNSTADALKNYRQRQYELNTVLSSNPQRLKQIWVILQNALADIVQPLIPAIIYLGQVVARMARWFANLNPSVQKLILTVGLFIGLLGPLTVYLGSLGSLFGTIAYLARIGIMFVGALFKDLWKLITVPLSILGTGFGWLAGKVLRLGIVFAGVGRTIFSGFFTLLFGGFRLIGPVVSASIAAMAGRFAALRGFFAVLMTQFRVLFVFLGEGFIKLPEFLMLGFRSIFTFMGRFLGIFVGMFSRLPALIGGAFARIGPAIWAVLSRIGPMLVRIFTGPIGWVITAIIALVAIFHKQISTAWHNVVAAFQRNGQGIISAFQPIAAFFGRIIDWIQKQFYKLPQGVQNAFSAVVRVVAAAAREVYKLFSYLNPFAHHSPSLVENTHRGMRVVRAHHEATASSARNLYQQTAADINTFTAATGHLDTPAKQFADQRANVKAVDPKALASFDRLIADLTKLEAVEKRQQAAVDAQQRVVDAWSAKLQKANDYLDKQQGLLEQLQKHLDAVQAKMDAHKNALDAFANAPLKGMKKMNDQIFNNELASKKLQLAMMKWQDVHGSIDQIQNKLSGLRGEIDKLRGEQSSLRAAGAGSDILGVYDKQIASLEKQQNKITDSTNAYNKMQTQLDKLNQKGQELQLTYDVTFDPLVKSVSDLANAQKELPYSKVIAGIKNEKQAMKDLQPSLDAANKAVTQQQKVVDKATAARDRIQHRYDAESNKLQRLQNEYQKTADMISKVTDALNSMGDAAQRARDAKKNGKKSQTAQNFLDAAGGNFPDVGGLGKIGREGGLGDQSKTIYAWAKQQADQLGKSFGKFNLFAPIEKFWQKFKAWWDKTVSPFIHAIGQALGQAWQGIKNAFSGSGGTFEKILKPLQQVWNWIKRQFKLLAQLFGPDIKRIFSGVWNGLKDVFKQVWPQIKAFTQLLSPLWRALKVVGEIIAVYFIARIKAIATLIGAVIRPAFHVLATTFSGALQIIRGVIGVIVHLFNGVLDVIKFFFQLLTGNWGKAWKTLKKFIIEDLGGLAKDVWNIIDGIWRIVVGIFKGAVTAIWNVVKAIVQGIVGFFKWLWDELVGHSIVPDIVNGIIAVFKTLISIVQWIWDNVLKPIYDFFVSIWNDFIGPFLSTLFGLFKLEIKAMIGIGKWIWNNVLKPIYDFFKSLWKDYVGPALRLWWDAVKTAWSALKKVGQWVWDNVLKPVWDFVSNLWTKYVGPAFRAWWGLIKTVWADLTKVGKWVWDNVLAPVWHFVSNLWTKYIGPGLKAWWGFMKTAWKDLEGAGKWVWDHVLAPIVHFFGKIWSYIGPIFSHLKSMFQSVWRTIGGFIVDGINIGISAVNGLIRALNWVGRNLPGVHWHIDTLKHLHKPGDKAAGPSGSANVAGAGGHPISQATGGTVPPFITNGARAIVGEGRRAYPEYVIPTDPQYRGRALALAHAAMEDLHSSMPKNARRRQVRGYADGGILGGLAHVVKTVISTPQRILNYGAKKYILSKFQGYYNVALALANSIPWKPVRELSTHFLGTIWEWANSGFAEGGVLPAGSSSMGLGGLFATGGILGTQGMRTGGFGTGTLKRGSSYALGTAVGQAVRRARPSHLVLVPVSHTEHHEYHFHGNLEFPNIKDGNDADEFIKNLRTLAG